MHPLILARMPTYLAAATSPGNPPEEPYKRRGLEYRRIALAAIILTVIDLPPFSHSLGALVQYIGQAVVAGAKGITTSLLFDATGITLPLRSAPPLFAEGPDVVSYFPRLLSADEMAAHTARSIGRAKGKSGTHGYLFRAPTFSTLGWIDANEGTMNSSNHAGAVSANACYFFFVTGKWFGGFTKGYGGVTAWTDLHGFTVSRTVSRGRVFRVERTIPARQAMPASGSTPAQSAVPESRVVERMQGDSPKPPEGSRETWKLLSCIAEYTVKPSETPSVLTTPTSIPAFLAHGIVFPFLNGMFTPEPFALVDFFYRYILEVTYKGSVLHTFAEIKAAFGELSSTIHGQEIGHLMLGIKVAMSSGLEICPCLANGQYLGFVLGGHRSFGVLFNGAISHSTPRQGLCSEIAELFSESGAAQELATLLSEITLDDPVSVALWNKQQVTEEEILSGTACPLLSIHHRLNHLGEGERAAIRQLMEKVRFTQPRYLSFSPANIALALSRFAASKPWLPNDEVFDLAFRMEDLFEPDPRVLVMKAFGLLGFSLNATGGTKFQLRGPRWDAFLNDKRQMVTGRSARGEPQTRNVARNTTLNIPRSPYTEAARALALDLERGFALLLTDTATAIPTTTVSIKGPGMKVVWEAAHDAAMVVGGEDDRHQPPPPAPVAQAIPGPSASRRRLDTGEEEEDVAMEGS